MNDTIQQFIMLFRGRADAIGTWQGGSKREPLTAEHFERHLTTNDPDNWIGVYPHLGSRGVSWGCIDIDGKDFDHDWGAMWDLALKLQKVLAVKDVYAYIERTRNGFHLWVFPADGIVPAEYMRRALMAACKACKYDPKEVNPKQEDLAPGRLGNYVRLPYYGALAQEALGDQPDRYFVTPDEKYLSLPDFLSYVQHTSTEALQKVAALWTPPERVTFDGPPPEDVQVVLQTLSGLAFTVWKDGPLEGRDRSNTLSKLAHLLCEEQVPMPSAFAVVKSADQRWGKFADRPDCDEQIMNIVERAYSV